MGLYRFRRMSFRYCCPKRPSLSLPVNRRYALCGNSPTLPLPHPPDPSAAGNPDKIAEWLPVDMYIGGAEHATMHLLYARYFVKALRDMGYLEISEPFTRLYHQGTVLRPDGV